MRVPVTLARIAGFRLVVGDGEAAARFYAALGAVADDERAIDAGELALLGIRGGGRRRPLRIGRMRIDLDRFEHAGRPYPLDVDAPTRLFQHFALVTDDVGSHWARARAAGAVPISRAGPETLPAGSGGVTAIKFRDPDGHPLELISFPDAASRGWRGRGVLGIDHSALVTTDLAAARGFWEAHGLVEGEAGVNRGPTQARLDGVDDPVVDVVPMQPAASTPHVELLHYHQPSATPTADWSPADIAATRIVWAGESPALIRDPDGHFQQVDPSAD